eukprot:GHVU01013909.1.p2 GENE.GHVU01013909.1~~GHVU01013909.1.p2  ORF type:complete len:122 (-),score=16.85 GHVU01013909.1:2204-2569(-)
MYFVWSVVVNADDEQDAIEDGKVVWTFKAWGESLKAGFHEDKAKSESGEHVIMKYQKDWPETEGLETDESRFLVTLAYKITKEEDIEKMTVEADATPSKSHLGHSRIPADNPRSLNYIFPC